MLEKMKSVTDYCAGRKSGNGSSIGSRLSIGIGAWGEVGALAERCRRLLGPGLALMTALTAPASFFVGGVLLTAVHASYADEVMAPTAVADYQTLSAALEAFDQFHSLAPRANGLLFRLQASAWEKGEYLPVDFSKISLQIQRQGNVPPLPISVAADGSFSLPDPGSLEKADQLMMTGHSVPMSLSPQVRSPGVPVSARRLGDLRLECRARTAFAQAGLGMFTRAFILTTTGRNWCENEGIKHTFYAEQPLRGVAVVSGSRRLEFTAGLSAASGYDDYAFRVPLNDTAWPDDALVVFSYGKSLIGQVGR